MTAKIGKYLAVGAAAVVVALAAGCDNEFCDPQPNPAEGGRVYLTLGVPQIEETVVSRAAADDPDNVIYSAQVFVFDEAGQLIHKEQLYDGYAQRKPYDTSQALGIPVQTGDRCKNCSIYAFANVAIWDAAPVGAYNFDAIQTLGDLKKVYSYRKLQSSFPEARDHRPMVGSVEGVDLTVATSVGAPKVVEMERVLAKINFKITVSADFSFCFTGWSVGEMPRYTLAVPQPLDFADSPHDESDLAGLPRGFYFPESDEKNLMNIAIENPQWITNSSSEPVSFFMYENRRGGRAKANWDNVQGTSQAVNPGHIDATTGTDPRFKTLYAPDHASYIVVKGLVKKNQTDQASESVRSFSYKIALGGNNFNDYNIERNHSYTYNLRINGMTDNDVSVKVEDFDSRAHRGYGIHIAAPNIDRIDAHYDKRYIHVTAIPGTIDFALYKTMDEAKAPDGQPMDEASSWVQLSKSDTYNIDIDPNESTKKTLDFSAAPTQVLYLYTDENATTRMRTAVLKISHTVDNADDLPPIPSSGASGGEVEMQIVENDDGSATVNYYYNVKQAGLLPVTLASGETFYVESYEEYQMKIDPAYEGNPAEGMQWGWGIETDESGKVTTYYNFENGEYLWSSMTEPGTLGTAYDADDGFSNTKAIFDAEYLLGGVAFPDVVTSAEFATKSHVEELYNNYAARYCYNKNKRKANGAIDGTPKWYLPAFNELCALTKEDFATAAGGWTPFPANTGIYWSSTVPKADEVNEKPVNADWYKFVNRWIPWVGFGVSSYVFEQIFGYPPPSDVSKWGDALWYVIQQDMIAEGDDYEPRNVAKAVEQGEIQLERKEYTSGNNRYYFDLYTPRKSVFNVRAVRSADGVTVE